MISRRCGVRPSDSNLADYVQVISFENGLLKIELVRRLPEKMNPRRIAIGGVGNDIPTIERKSAA
jgi:molecular chaperone IbpA